MALGLSAAVAANFVNALVGGASFTSGTDDPWIKLHLTDPGAAGTSGAAVNTTRQQATFTTGFTATISNTNTITWSSVPATETYRFFSAWTASTAGTFLFSGTVNAAQVTATGNFVVAVGGLDVVLANVAA
jgi:hypothetical protein